MKLYKNWKSETDDNLKKDFICTFYHDMVGGKCSYHKEKNINPKIISSDHT